MNSHDVSARDSASPIPSSIGNPALTALTSHGITTLQQISQQSEDQLLSLHGVGPKAIRILKEEMSRLGLKFKP